MISHYREAFNRQFSEESYQRLMKRLDAACGTHVEFRVSETPCFLPKALMESMARAGEEIITQLIGNPSYMRASNKAIPYEYDVPNEPPCPLFAAVDFGIACSPGGGYAPRLIELQGFPTLFAFQVVLSQQYTEVYTLPPELRFLPDLLTLEEYSALVRKAILGNHAPEHVVLMELDPLKQKTRPDFILTDRMCGTRTVNIREIVKDGKRLVYNHEGKRIEIRRIYNRTIVDDVVRSGAQLPFSFRDELDVEWAGHPNWFFRLSKFSLPYVRHETAPKTYFLNDVADLPDDLQNWVLKPLYSFAGSGIVVSPSRADIDALPEDKRADYVLQERIEYSPVIATPHGGTKIEVRILYLWLNRPIAVANLIRMGRGKMMGVDFNKSMAWVGSSAGFYPE